VEDQATVSALQVILTDDVDVPVGCMRDDIDLRIANEKVRQDVAHRELHRGHGRRAVLSITAFAPSPLAEESVAPPGKAQATKRRRQPVRQGPPHDLSKARICYSSCFGFDRRLGEPAAGVPLLSLLERETYLT
jgi:hypothetical protein